MTDNHLSTLADGAAERVVPSYTFEGVEVVDSVAGQMENDPRFTIEHAEKGEFGLDQGTTVLDFRVDWDGDEPGFYSTEGGFDGTETGLDAVLREVAAADEDHYMKAVALASIARKELEVAKREGDVPGDSPPTAFFGLWADRASHRLTEVAAAADDDLDG